MGIAALLALLPELLNAGSSIANTVKDMQASGRTQTTPEEQAALTAALSRLKPDEVEFEDAFGITLGT
jgi:hypothetical protein